MAQKGRPRTFDRDGAVHDAMLLFWEHGYEQTTLAHLKREMQGGIAAPSFYAAFGSKEQLFGEVVDRYMATYGQATSSLFEDDRSPREAVELALRRSARMQTDQGHPTGCLLVFGCSTVSSEQQAPYEVLAGHRRQIRGGFQRCIERGIRLGELPPTVGVESLATTFHTFLLGLSIQARDGASSDTLDLSVTRVMTLWDLARS